MGEGEQEGGMDLIKWWWRERREREEGKGKWKTRGAFNRGKKERERESGGDSAEQLPGKTNRGKGGKKETDFVSSLPSLNSLHPATCVDFEKIKKKH